jgi:S1-C subfamily serine protease
VTVLGLRSPASLAPAAGNAPPRARRSLASGIVYDAKGRVATVASAVRDCDAIHVRTADGRELKATLVGLDDDSDIALLQ